MSVEANPLTTRCLPASPCLRFPQDLVVWDTHMRESWHRAFQNDPEGLEQLRWLIETPMGITVLAVSFLTMFWICFRWPALPNFRRGFRLVLTLVLGAGLSDLVSFALKIYFGRLKPHVTFYNPAFYPALSFPSNHAFNTTFFCAWFFIESRKLLPRFTGARAVFGVFLAVVLLFIGYSRVVLGEHYPLDTVAGFLFGLGFAALYSWVVKLATSTKPL